MRFHRLINVSHEILCRPGLVGPKIAFSVEETGGDFKNVSARASARLLVPT